MNKEQKLKFDAGKRDALEAIQGLGALALKPVVDDVGESCFYGMGWNEVVNNTFGNN
ncbi:hypothetical protein [Pseudoalteromonas luteoviolacea]|uniref:Uncharacterized protein n=1 Tax=Pseudoalteromonas luteoviolacea S4060-1 TaxID=1365257 RepID=A0A162C781_9GAMM|nr:hypothetical protein [Pseudoalteromonas luteoviolacea]KZN63303.1 hypothetical protein N478_03375 [Pseudoalteromonas luteoviolacea S4060-1]